VLPSRDGSRVVLIGTSRFTDPGLADLPAVRNNLTGLARCFQDNWLWGLPAANCAVVSDPTSIDEVIDPVHDAAAEAEDTLLVYYSGHGLIDQETNELLLALVGSRSGRSHTAVPYEYLRRDVNGARARRRVVILDCCYSGKALGGMSDASAAVADQASADGTYLMASAPPNQQAISPPGEQFSAFTGELISLLREGRQDGERYFRLDAIYNHIYYALRDRSLPQPQKRAGNTAGDLALARNRLWPGAEFDPDRIATELSQELDYLNLSNRIKQLVSGLDLSGPRICMECGQTVPGADFVDHLYSHGPANKRWLGRRTLGSEPSPD
jgi:hypothetical protein